MPENKWKGRFKSRLKYAEPAQSFEEVLTDDIEIEVKRPPQMPPLMIGQAGFGYQKPKMLPLMTEQASFSGAMRDINSTLPKIQFDDSRRMGDWNTQSVNDPLSPGRAIEGLIRPFLTAGEDIGKGAEYLGKSKRTGKVSDLLRGFGHLGLGTIEGGLAAIPGVAALNASMPYIMDASGVAAEGLGFKKEQGQKVAGVLAPFIFGKWVGAGSITSSVVDELLKDSGTMKELFPDKEDRTLAERLITTGTFFGIAGGGKKFENYVKGSVAPRVGTKLYSPEFKATPESKIPRRGYNREGIEYFKERLNDKATSEAEKAQIRKILEEEKIEGFEPKLEIKLIKGLLNQPKKETKNEQAEPKISEQPIGKDIEHLQRPAESQGSKPAGSERKGGAEELKVNDNALQLEIMQKAGIPEEEMPDYASVADGKILRTYLNEIKAGEISVDEAVERVKRDYSKMKSGAKEGKFIEPELTPQSKKLIKKVFGREFEDLSGPERVKIVEMRAASGSEREFYEKLGEKPKEKPKEKPVQETKSLSDIRKEKFLKGKTENLDKLVSEGWKPIAKDIQDKNAITKLEKEIDYLKKEAPMGNENHPDTIRLKELQRQLKEGVTKKSYRLEKEGTIKDISKTEYDYLESKGAEETFLYTFNSGGFKKQSVEKLPDRYVRTKSGEEYPIEDFGDYLLSDKDMTTDQAFESWAKNISKSEPPKVEKQPYEIKEEKSQMPEGKEITVYRGIAAEHNPQFKRIGDLNFWTPKQKYAIDYSGGMPKSTIYKLKINEKDIAPSSGAWDDGLVNEKFEAEWLRENGYIGKWYKEKGIKTLGILPEYFDKLNIEKHNVHALLRGEKNWEKLSSEPTRTPKEGKQPYEITRGEYAKKDFFITVDNKLKFFGENSEIDLLKDQLSEYNNIRNKYPKELNSESATKLNRELKKWQVKLLNDYHKQLIQQALKEGKQIPEEVLKDYPDLEKPNIDDFKQTLVNISTTDEGVSIDGIKKARELADESKDLFTTKQRNEINDFIKKLQEQLKEEKPLSDNERIKKDQEFLTKNKEKAGKTIEEIFPREQEKIVDVAKSTEDKIVETPRHKIPLILSDKIEEGASNLLNEVENAKVEKDNQYFKTVNKGEGWEVEGKRAGVTISTFPEWFTELGAPKDRIIAALKKIIEDNGKDKGVLVERLKRIILSHLTGGRDAKQVSIRSSSGKEHSQKIEIPPDEEVVDFLNKMGSLSKEEFEQISKQTEEKVKDKKLSKWQSELESLDQQIAEVKEGDVFGVDEKKLEKLERQRKAHIHKRPVLGDQLDLGLKGSLAMSEEGLLKGVVGKEEETPLFEKPAPSQKESLFEPPKEEQLIDKSKEEKEYIDHLLSKSSAVAEEPAEKPAEKVEPNERLGNLVSEAKQLSFDFKENNSEIYITEDNKKIPYQSHATKTDKIQRTKKRSYYTSSAKSALRSGDEATIERRYRAYKQLKFYAGKEKIDSPEDVAYIFRQLEEETIEHTAVLYVTKDGKKIVQHLTTGSISASIVDMRVIFDAIKRFDVKDVFFVHNHPSGNLEASPEDKVIVTRLERALPKGVQLKDALIINKRDGKYASIKGEVKGDLKNYVADKITKLKPISFSREVFLSEQDIYSEIITTARPVAEYFSSNRLGIGKKTQVFLLNTQNRIVGRFGIKNIEDATVDESRDYIAYLLSRFGGAKVILAGNIPHGGIRAKLSIIQTGLKEANIDLLDYVGVQINPSNLKYFSSMTGTPGEVREPGVKFNENLEGKPTQNSEGGLIHPTKEGRENFWKWFGESKVVDSEGKPLVVYHGTDEKGIRDNKFDREFLGSETISNASNPRFAATSLLGYWFNDGSIKNSSNTPYKKYVPVFLNIQNPRYYDSIEDIAGDLSPIVPADVEYEEWDSIKEDVRNYVEQLQSDGYDGIVVGDEEFGGTSYIAFEPSQIKSATGNTGDFGVTEPIIFASYGSQGAKELQAQPKVMSEFKGSDLNNVTRLRDIGKNMVKDIGLVEGKDVRTGKKIMRRFGKMLGFYSLDTGIVRIKNMNDVGVIAHELGHKLDFEVFAETQNLRFKKGDKLERTITLVSGYKNAQRKAKVLDTLRKKHGQEAVDSILERVELRAELKKFGGSIGKYYEKTSESIAEFISRYVTDPAEVRTKAPRFYNFFENILDQNPNIRKALLTAREQVAKFKSQDPRQITESTIARDDDTDSFLSKIKEAFEGGFFYNIFDSTKPLRDLVKKLEEKGTNIEGKDNPLQQTLSLIGVDGKAKQYLENHPFIKEGNDLKILTDKKPFFEIFKRMLHDGSLKEHEGYLTALRNIELYKNKKEQAATTTLDIAEKTKTLYEEQLGKDYLETLVIDLRGYNQALLDYYQQSGKISPEILKSIKELNQYYVPFKRFFEEFENTGQAPNVSKYIKDSSPSPVKQIRGSQREIVSPIGSIIKNTYDMIASADRNTALKTIIESLRKVDKSLVQEIPPRAFKPVNVIREPKKVIDFETGQELTALPKEGEGFTETKVGVFYEKPQGENIITVWYEGKPKYFEIPKEFYDSFFSISEPVSKAIRILSAPSRLLQAGAVIYDPTFSVRNIARDQITAVFISKYDYNPLDIVRGLFAAGKKDEVYQKFLASGADQSFLTAMDQMLSKNYMQARTGNRIQTTFQKYRKNPLEILRDLNRATEIGTRAGAFKKAYLKSGDVWAAMQEGREITADYGVRGKMMSNISPLLPFFNARLQHINITQRAARGSQGSRAKKMAIGIGFISAPAIIIWLMNNIEEERKKRYNELPLWRRYGFFNIPIPGTQSFFPLPKGFFGQLFGTSVEAVLDWTLNNSPETIEDLAQELFTEVSPLSSPIDFVPQFGRPIIEQFANKKGFTGAPIVGKGLEMLNPAEQYTDATSEFAKYVGQKINLSPARIDAFIQGYTAGAGRGVLNISDEFLQLTGVVDDSGEDTFTRLSRLPILKAFVTETPLGTRGRSVQEFYEKLDELESMNKMVNNYIKDDNVEKLGEYLSDKEADYKFYIKNQTEINKFKDVLRVARDLRYDIYKNPDVPNKREKIVEMEQEVTNMAIEFKRAFEDGDKFRVSGYLSKMREDKKRIEKRAKEKGKYYKSIYKGR